MRLTELENSLVFEQDKYFSQCHASTILKYEDKLFCAFFAGTKEGDDDVRIYLAVNENGKWGSSREYFYDELGRISKTRYKTSNEMQANYDVLYTYDEDGCLVRELTDYYYGDDTTYTYELFTILVPVYE